MLNSKDVDAFISQAPKEVQSKLKELRAMIKKIAPKAEERISYGMPFYDYKGRLAYFGIWKTHIGLYIPPPVIAEHEAELTAYKTTKSAVHLPLDKKLPAALIKKIIKARIKLNDQGKGKFAK